MLQLQRVKIFNRIYLMSSEYTTVPKYAKVMDVLEL